MLLYRIFIWLYPKFAFLLSHWNRKAKLWGQGRQGLLNQLQAAFADEKRPVIWMHCASLGEFEQGLPVLERLRNQYPGHCLLVTFFSPSGYEVRKNYPGADRVFYLPMDSPGHAKQFFDIVQPKMILFIKYEFWYYYLSEANKRNIPLLLVSGVFRKQQAFFAWYGGFQRKMLGLFTALFVQNQVSAELLQTIGLNNVIVCGDTRFDRVLKIAQGFEPVAAIDHFCGDKPVLVAGSTWTDDDEELDHFSNTHTNLRCIIVPHEIDEERLQECLTLYKGSMLYSVYENAFSSGTVIADDVHVMIIDNIGMLSRLYKYGTVCYVGGGFGDDGIHNILEAVVYGKPVVFGPVFEKYTEANELVDAGAAFPADDALELEEILNDLFTHEPMRKEAASIAVSYVEEKSGATNKVLAYIQEKRLLTS